MMRMIRKNRGWFVFGGLAGALVACIAQALLAAHGASPNTQKGSTQMEQAASTPVHIPKGKEVATLAGGCFWCTEAIFRELKGVDTVEPGYAGGKTRNPSYEQVCSGTTGHAESVEIIFDPKVISFGDILRIFFTVHNPTTLNQQGADMGTQYRSAIFYHNEEQKKTAQQVIHEIQAAHLWDDPIVTEVTPFTNFYKAEDYHQNYFERNPYQGYCQIVIAPKVAKFREHYREKLKK